MYDRGDNIEEQKKTNANTNTYIISLLALIITAVGVSISFLVVTSNVSVRDAYATDSIGWNVSFKNISKATLLGSAEEYSSPTLVGNSTVIKDFRVVFQSIGDAVSYTYEVANSGKLDAKVSSIDYTTPFCFGSGSNAARDAKMVCEGIEIKMTYADGREIQRGDIIKSGEAKEVRLTVTYNGKGMPIQPVTAEDLAVTVVYVQN